MTSRTIQSKPSRLLAEGGVLGAICRAECVAGKAAACAGAQPWMAAAAALPPGKRQLPSVRGVWHQNLETDPGSAAGLRASGVSKARRWRERAVRALVLTVGPGESQACSLLKAPGRLRAYFNFCLETRLETTTWNRQ